MGRDDLPDRRAELLVIAIVDEERRGNAAAGDVMNRAFELELVVKVDDAISPRWRKLFVEPEAVGVDDSLTVAHENLAVEGLRHVVQSRAELQRPEVAIFVLGNGACQIADAHHVVVGVVPPGESGPDLVPKLVRLAGESFKLAQYRDISNGQGVSEHHHDSRILLEYFATGACCDRVYHPVSE